MPLGTLLGGAERLLHTFLERADSIGVDPYVVFFEDGPWIAEVEQLGVGVRVIDPGRFRQVGRNLSASAELRKVLIEQRPDVTLGWITLAPAAVAAGLGKTLAWYQHRVTNGRPLDRAAALLPARRVFACSAAAGRAQGALWPHRPIHVAYPGCDAPEPLPAAAIEALRRQLGIPGGRAVIGISGRFERWKGQDKVIRAVDSLRADGRDVHGLIIGGPGHGVDPEYGPELHALVEKLGLGDRVSFSGHVADPLPHTQLLDVAVNASEEEPFGIVLLEAMALERPVVAVNRAGPSEIVENGISGVLVERADPALFAAAIAQLLDDPDRRRALGVAGRARVLERFTIERWLGDLRAGLDAVAGRP
jgi:glycosyltransferase involved in cell wall biosynthesis